MLPRAPRPHESPSPGRAWLAWSKAASCCLSRIVKVRAATPINARAAANHQYPGENAASAQPIPKTPAAEEQRPKLWLSASGRQKRSAHCADRHDRRQQTESARIGMENIHRHGGDEYREIKTECADQKEHDYD